MTSAQVDRLVLGRRLDFIDDRSNSPGYYFCAPLGGLYVTGRKGGRFSIVLGPDWCFIFITLSLIIIPSSFLILHFWRGIFSYLLIASGSLLTIAYLNVALSDPGILLKVRACCCLGRVFLTCCLALPPSESHTFSLLYSLHPHHLLTEEKLLLRHMDLILT